MSVGALKWAFDLALNDHAEKVVLLALADHFNDQSQCCWPSMARLERFTGADERTIQRAIARLIESGHVAREERSGSSSLFFLNLEGAGDNWNPRQIDTPPPSGRRGTPGKVSPYPRQNDAHNSYRTPIDPLSKAAAALAPDGARPSKGPTTREEWATRLAGYKPSEGVRTWLPFWGPRPDQPGDTGQFMPRDLLTKWRVQNSVVNRGP